VVEINPKFDPIFDQPLFDVMPFSTKKSPIPAVLSRVFGPKGYFCLRAQQAVIRDYGFEPTRQCGSVS
jgi:hypothetical protein